jgi:hypothetical protein
MVLSSITRVVMLALVIVLALAPQIHAADRQYYGKWAIGQATNETQVWAFTVNDSEHGLGFVCTYGTGCDWQLMLQLKCDPGVQYGVLAKRAALQVQCQGEAGRWWRYTFTDFHAAEWAIGPNANSGRVEFVMALESGEFRVMRFELQGMRDALTALLARVEKRVPKPPTGTADTRDTLL